MEDSAQGRRKTDDWDVCYEAYYVREDGLKLLLAGLGQTEWYGLFSEPSAVQSGASQGTESVNGILADLYQNGVIDWDGAGVAVRQPYAKMLSCMLEKKACVTIQTPDDAAPVCCCYISNASVVLTQKSQREEHTLGMAQIPAQSWIAMLEETCARMEAGENSVFACRSSEDGRVRRCIRVRKDGLRSFRMEWDEDGGGCVRCMREETGKKLWELFGMDI